MATATQTKYIEDLAVIKTKEFKEVKELLISNEIVKKNSEVVASAGTLAEICNALTEQQASKLIDALIATKEPTRQRVYSQNRTKKTIDALEDIKKTIDAWSFE